MIPSLFQFGSFLRLAANPSSFINLPELPAPSVEKARMAITLQSRDSPMYALEIRLENVSRREVILSIRPSRSILPPPFFFALSSTSSSSRKETPRNKSHCKSTIRPNALRLTTVRSFCIHSRCCAFLVQALSFPFPPPPPPPAPGTLTIPRE